MKPLIYFSYGMTKTGSTLAYHIAHVALEDAGCEQPKIPAPMVEEWRKINFITHLSKQDVDALWEITKTLGYPLLVKTHTRPDPAVIAAINAGQAIASVASRDPRDMALSMLDHGKKARRRGVLPFAEIQTIADTVVSIREQLESRDAWLELPNTLPLNYEEIAFDTETIAEQLLDHMGIPGNPAQIAKTAKARFTQLNKGIPHRHETEMSRQDSEYILTNLDKPA